MVKQPGFRIGDRKVAGREKVRSCTRRSPARDGDDPAGSLVVLSCRPEKAEKTFNDSCLAARALDENSDRFSTAGSKLEDPGPEAIEQRVVEFSVDPDRARRVRREVGVGNRAIQVTLLRGFAFPRRVSRPEVRARLRRLFDFVLRSLERYLRSSHLSSLRFFCMNFRWRVL